MPGSLKPIIFLRKKLRELLAPGWIRPGPVYAACSLMIIAAVLTMGVAVSLQSTGIQPPETILSGGETTRSDTPAGVEQSKQQQIIVQQAAAVERPGGQPDPEPEEALAAAAGQAAVWPVKGEVNQAFGWQFHPVFNDWRYHPGIDISAADGTFVQAMLSGRISDIFTDNKTGLTVVIVSGKYTIGYGSLDTINVSLKKGSYVNRGDKIGTVGSCATEPYTHLHLTIKEKDQYLDPRKILK